MAEAQASLRRISPAELERTARPPVDAATLEATRSIVEDVRSRGAGGVREYANRFGERSADEPLVLGRALMESALESM